MNHKFQKWVDASHFSLDAKHLLDSSITCYKSEAYTAALIMGYLGFLLTLKERLMKANKPSVFPQNDWNIIIAELRDENKWEQALMNAVMMRENRNPGRLRDAIFPMSDGLRLQIEYWRGRRNDCAHHKDNAILGAHVEAFWSFLESNLQKITVSGGFATLINKFTRHYDPAYTPANADVTPLLKEIKSSVEKVDMPDFWKQLFPIANDLFDYAEEVNIIKKVLSFNDAGLKDSMITHLKTTNSLLMGCVTNYPSLLSLLDYDQQEIRNFWMTKVASMRNPMQIYASMLRNNLIPEDQLDDSMEHMAKVLKYPSDPDDHLLLQSLGFGEFLYKKLFVTNSAAQIKYWDFMNNNSELYTTYIKLYPLKDEVVTILCTELAKTEWSPKWLQGRVDALFKENPSKKQEFIDKAAVLGAELPATITALFN